MALEYIESLPCGDDENVLVEPREQFLAATDDRTEHRVAGPDELDQR